ncbi:hypothetical protein [Aminobacter sp. LjRoot7]|uniref:hypothetical protein n=1 Tax=Aminobacter sp. LjRoot7 TaxID=3342335 RepID=UPI003ECCFD19
MNEIERKDKLDSGIGVILTAITAVSISMVYIFEKVSSKNGYDGVILVSIFFAICAFMIAISIAFLVYGFHGRPYRYVGYANDVWDYYNKLISYHGVNKTAADSDFLAEMTDQFARFATHNAQENDKKSEGYFQAKLWFAWSLLPFACGVVVFVHFLIWG